jgi:hypothetical protein
MHEDALAVYDAHGALGRVASWRTGPVDGEVAVHPSGRAVVALTGSTLGLWRAGADVPVRASSGITGGRSEWSVTGWVRYSADGAYLYLGEARVGEPARLSLLDSATLARVDTVSPVGVHVWDEPIEDWGEDLDARCAPSPSTAVAFATNSGDDLIALAVAEAADGLCLYSGRAKESWAEIPGERCMAITLDGDELLVLDSDQILSSIRWRDRPMTVRRLTYGGDLLEDDEVRLVGPMCTRGRLLAVTVARDLWASGRSDQPIVTLIIIDRDTGEGLARLDLPEAEYIDLTNGTICQRAGDRTLVSRWVGPT